MLSIKTEAAPHQALNTSLLQEIVNDEAIASTTPSPTSSPPSRIPIFLMNSPPRDIPGLHLSPPANPSLMPPHEDQHK